MILFKDKDKWVSVGNTDTGNLLIESVHGVIMMRCAEELTVIEHGHEVHAVLSGVAISDDTITVVDNIHRLRIGTSVRYSPITVELKTGHYRTEISYAMYRCRHPCNTHAEVYYNDEVIGVVSWRNPIQEIALGGVYYGLYDRGDKYTLITFDAVGLPKIIWETATEAGIARTIAMDISASLLGMGFK